MKGIGFLKSSIWPYRLVRLALAGLFLAAGAVKLSNPEAFAATIQAFGLLPKVLVDPAALLLPAVEILAGVGLVLDHKGSLAVITVLTVMFIFVLAYGLWLGLDIDCGCYGPGDPEAGAFSTMREALIRDLAMLAGEIYLIWGRARGMMERRPLGAWKKS